MIDCGAPISCRFYDLHNIKNNPDEIAKRFNVIRETVSHWDLIKMTKWLYSELKEVSYLSDGMTEFVLKLFELCKSTIDFNYRKSKSTQSLILLFLNKMHFTPSHNKKLTELLADEEIDLSRGDIVGKLLGFKCPSQIHLAEQIVANGSNFDDMEIKHFELGHAATSPLAKKLIIEFMDRLSPDLLTKFIITSILPMFNAPGYRLFLKELIERYLNDINYDQLASSDHSIFTFLVMNNLKNETLIKIIDSGTIDLSKIIIFITMNYITVILP